MAVIGATPEEDVMSAINITPLTDVLLVLLIIFMILTSLLKPPPVPEAINRLKVQNSPLVVIIGHDAVKKQDTIQVGADVIPKDKLHDYMQTYGLQFSTLKDIIIKAAPTAHYGTVLLVMYEAKQAGFDQFGLANKVHGQAQTINE